MAKQHRFRILRGPSKHDWFIALSVGDSRNRYFIEFTVEPDGPPGPRRVYQSVVINQISREDGSGERWNFQGWYTEPSNWQEMVGCYDTSTRRGILTLTEE